MRNVIYQGKPCRLGRFGPVKKGDCLNMTDREWRMVSNDQANQDRFREAKKGEADKAKDATSELAKANRLERVATIELKEKSTAELRDLAQELKDQGYSIEVRKDQTHATLVRNIRAAYGLSENPTDASE